MNHSARLLTILTGLLVATLSSAEMSGEMVAAHNSVRATVKVPDLTWSNDLAAYAREWAEHLRDQKGCKPEHRPYDGKFAQKHGENLYWGSAMVWSNGKREPQRVDAAGVVQSWAKEVANYDYAKNHCSGVCGHYTQMVWRDSRQVGCAMALCDDSKDQIWVCSYDPPGNWQGEKPY